MVLVRLALLVLKVLTYGATVFVVANVLFTAAALLLVEPLSAWLLWLS